MEWGSNLIYVITFPSRIVSAPRPRVADHGWPRRRTCTGRFGHTPILPLPPRPRRGVTRGLGTSQRVGSETGWCRGYRRPPLEFPPILRGPFTRRKEDLGGALSLPLKKGPRRTPRSGRTHVPLAEGSLSDRGREKDRPHPPLGSPGSTPAPTLYVSFSEAAPTDTKHDTTRVQTDYL